MDSFEQIAFRNRIHGDVVKELVFDKSRRECVEGWLFINRGLLNSNKNIVKCVPFK